MPASLPGSNDLDNAGNPNEGNWVIFDPLSGPKGAPLDAKEFDYSTGTPPGWDATTRLPILIDSNNLSTGGLSTGIGISCQHTISDDPTSPEAIFAAGFNDNNTPGKQTLTYAAAPAIGVVATDEFDSTMLYIGGGRMVAGSAAQIAQGLPFIPSPYTAGIALCGAGNGGSRDSGAETGFAMKMVTATGAVANGAAVEAGFVNRSGAAMVSGESVFGSAAVALAAAA